MRKITIRYHDEYTTNIIEYTKEFDKNELDSEQLHLALCEIYPHPDYGYTVEFENVSK
jgi:hypothetical protein